LGKNYASTIELLRYLILMREIFFFIPEMFVLFCNVATVWDFKSSVNFPIIGCLVHGSCFVKIETRKWIKMKLF